MREKPESVVVGGRRVRRVMVRTGLLTERDRLDEAIRRYVVPVVEPGDVVTIAESPVAVMEGRAIPVSRIRPGFWARVLWRFVRKVPYGIGLRSPWSMQCAIEEVGAPRILRASLAGAWGKLRGRRGDFYFVAGQQAAMIDAAGTSGVTEFRGCVIKGPADPDRSARLMAEVTGCAAAVVDANDVFGCKVVGASTGLDVELVETAMADNPAGQGDALTPVVLLRLEGPADGTDSGKCQPWSPGDKSGDAGCQEFDPGPGRQPVP